MKKIKTADLVIDLEHQTVLKEGKIIPVKKSEYIVLLKLVCNPNQVLLVDSLMAELENHYLRDFSLVTLRAHIYRLRSQLGTYQGRNYIETKVSFGYLWKYSSVFCKK